MLRTLGLLLIFVSLGVTAAANDARSGSPEFAVDVMSVLSKAGCNAGTCHGNLNGKGGFKLSLRGDDPQHDFNSLVLAARGRRVNLMSASRSLILQKATGAAPHRGGIRFGTTSPEYQLLLDWLRDGAPGPSADAATVTRLEVQPSQVIVASPTDDVQVRVTAFFSDGTSQQVTNRACYELSNLSASVDAGGRVSRNKFGETTLIVRYLQQQVPVSICFIEARPQYHWNETAENNEIDRHVFAKLRQLRINAANLCDDTVFVRRAFLDAIGRLPTADEAQHFVGDQDPCKRAKLIDALLSRPEFADFWALKWADVLRTEEKVLDSQGVKVFHGWIRDSLAAARPLDQFVRQLVLGLGSTFKNPPANFYRANRDPATRGETTARLFLGTRLQCAKCHNHPFDRWTQDDYYGWASFFSQIDYKMDKNERRDKLDKNEFAGEQTVVIDHKDEVRHPSTGQNVEPKLLGDEVVALDSTSNRLERLADWLVSSENELFVKSQTNFIWYQLMGVGLVNPIDDFRSTNPASHPALLDALARQFADSGFDIRFLVRQIMNSSTYQLSAAPHGPGGEEDGTYSHAVVRRLPAEVILDMQSDVLDLPAQFAGYSLGLRAVQIPGVSSKKKGAGSPKPGDRFLKTFGKPERILACDCERSNETTLKQAFVLLGDGLNSRLASPENQISRLAASHRSDSQIVQQLYWAALSRAPEQRELTAAVEMISAAQSDRAAALQDIAWALLNAKEFLFRR